MFDYSNYGSEWTLQATGFDLETRKRQQLPQKLRVWDIHHNNQRFEFVILQTPASHVLRPKGDPAQSQTTQQFPKNSN